MTDKPCEDTKSTELGELLLLIKDHMSMLEEGEGFSMRIVKENGRFKAHGKKDSDITGEVVEASPPETQHVQDECHENVAGDGSRRERDDIRFVVHQSSSEEFEDQEFSQRQDLAYYLHGDDNSP